MKTKKIILLFVAMLIAGSISAHAGGLIEMFTGGKDRGPQTNGKVTVRGLSKYEGKFVMGIADSDPALLAAGNITSAGVITAGAVKGGKAALKVWQGSYGSYGGFDGNDALSLLLAVYDREAPGGAVAMGLVEVNFRKGKGSGTGAFIAGSAFSGSMGSIADSFFAETIASSNNASGGGLLGDLLGILGSGLIDGGAVGEILGSGDATSAGLFSRIGSFFSGLFGGGRNAGANTAGGNVEELKARILAGDIAALQVLGELAQAGNRDALNAMIAMAQSGDLSALTAIGEIAGALPDGAVPGQTSGFTIPDTSGRLTITGLGDYNGRYISAESADTMLVAYESMVLAGNVNRTMAPISRGQATLKVWQLFSAYSGNDRNVSFEVYIGDGREIDTSSTVAGTVVANFSRGAASASFVKNADLAPSPYTWTAVADSTFGEAGIFAIAYGAGRFVAGGDYGKMAYSSDGARWTAVADSTFGEARIFAIAFGADKFVAVGDAARMAYSSDGAQWTAVAGRTFPDVNDQITAIAYGAGRFVAVSARDYIAYSSDGVDWTRVADSALQDHLYGLHAVAYGAGRFVASDRGGRVVYSSDGVNWTAAAGMAFDEYNYTSAIAWGAGRFVAVGTTDAIKHSSDGINWARVAYDDYRLDRLLDVAFGSAGSAGPRFAASGGDGRIVYSSDGVNWTAENYRPLGENDGITTIAFAGNRLIVGNRNGQMAYSTGR